MASTKATVSVMDTEIMRQFVALLGRVHSHLEWQAARGDEGSGTAQHLAREITELVRRGAA